MEEEQEQPDWSVPLTFSITPETIMSTVFATAEEVHCGWDTCVNPALILSETTAVDALTSNHCRLVEQEIGVENAGHHWTLLFEIAQNGQFHGSVHPPPRRSQSRRFRII